MVSHEWQLEPDLWDAVVINASLYAVYGLHQVTLGASIVAFSSKG